MYSHELVLRNNLIVALPKKWTGNNLPHPILGPRIIRKIGLICF